MHSTRPETTGLDSEKPREIGAFSLPFVYLHSLERFSIDEHSENIDIIKTYRKQQQTEIAYAIESHKCPRCGAPILKK